MVDSDLKTSNKEFSCVNQIDLKCKSNPGKKGTKPRHAHRTKRVNNNNTTQVSVPNDIDSYTVVDDYLKTSNKLAGQLPLLTAPKLERYSRAKPLHRHVPAPNEIDNYTVVDSDLKTSNKEFSCVNHIERKCKSNSSKKNTKSRHTHRTKGVNSNNFARVSVPNDIDSYTVVDDQLEPSNKELSRMKSFPGQKFFRRN